ncbi:MAG: WD40 repeat domain-containing serine/threonine protein kinase [Verrucomicrobiota bacterium]
MKPESPSADAIFAAALEISHPVERAQYVAEACGADAKLRSEVESLLAASAQASGFLEEVPTVVAGAMVSGSGSLKEEQPGDRIGRYKLLEQIGEGGFGVVWMAEQTEPVRRRVALKIIKLGMDSKQVVARFEAERQALALMDHPNIARVFDGGATETGRPFFVMELVKGLPITDYCDQNRLSPRQRLELFIEVCHGVQHAHQKGVIHRDLKPSNILVAVHDDRPVPKIIDFGIAKATQQPLTEHTLFTRFHQLLGTPSYMSPEQAGMSSLDVDTRSDIYSMGVLLYELLTGRTPFTKDELLSAGFEEMCRMIREKEPPRPSTRLSTFEGKLIGEIARQRRATPLRLRRLVRGDLDWIVMKALEKDRSRRYETANGLARDIERYLRHEPVSAAAPGLVYRLSKFARRHQLALATAAAIGFLLIDATVVSVRMAVAARDAKRLADDRWHETERARASEAAARLEAENAAVDANTNSGMLEARQRNDAEALLWFSAAAQRTNSDSGRRALSRLRVANWVEEVAHPVAAFFDFNEQVLELNFHPGLPFVITSGLSGRAAIWNLQTSQPIALPTMAEAVCCMQWNRAGNSVAVGATNGVLRIYSFPGWVLDAEQKLAESVEYVAYSPDDRTLAVASGSSVRFWDVGGRSFRSDEIAHSELVVSTQFDPTGKKLFSVTRDRQAQISGIDSETGRFKPLFPSTRHHFQFERSGSGLLMPVWLKGGAAIALHSSPSRIVILDSATGEEKHNFAFDNPASMRASPDGRQLAVGIYGAAEVRDATTGVRVGGVLPHKNTVFGLAFSPAGNVLFTGGWDAEVQMWKLREGLERTTLGVHQRNITCIESSPDGRFVATAQVGGLVRVWDISRQAIPTQWMPLSAARTRVKFSADGKYVYGAGSSYRSTTVGAVRIFETETGAAAGPLLYGNGIVIDATLSDSGRSIAIASSTQEDFWERPGHNQVFRGNVLFDPDGVAGVLAVFDPFTGDKICGPFPMPSEPRSVVFRPGREHEIAVLCAQGEVIGIDLRSGATNHFQKPYARRAHNGYTNNGLLRAGPRGETLIAWGIDNTVRAYLWETGAEIFSAIKLTAPCHDVGFSPDGALLVLAGYDNQVSFWRFPEGTAAPLAPLKHADWVFQIDFSSDGKWLVSAGRDHTGRVWDWMQGKPGGPAFNHGNEVKGIGFAGPYLITLGYDRVAQLWDLRSTHPLAPPVRTLKEPWDLAISPTGQHAAIGGDFNGFLLLRLTNSWNWISGLNEQDMALLSELLSGRRLESGSTVKLNENEWLDRWIEFRRAIPEALTVHRSSTASDPWRTHAFFEALEWRNQEAAGFHAKQLSAPLRSGADWLALRAELLAHSGRWTEAAELARSALATGQENLMMRTVQMLERANHRQWREAADALGPFLKRWPEHRETLNVRAQCQALAGQWNAAFTDLDRIMPFRMIDLELTLKFVVAAAKSGRNEEARRFQTELSRYFEGVEDPIALQRIVWTLTIVPWSQAPDSWIFQQCAVAAQRAKDNSDFAAAHGALLFRAGKIEEAIERLQTVTRPKRPFSALAAHHFLALACAKKGDATRAREVAGNLNSLPRLEPPKTAEEWLQQPYWAEQAALEMLEAELEEQIGPRRSAP